MSVGDSVEDSHAPQILHVPTPLDRIFATATLGIKNLVKTALVFLSNCRYVLLLRPLIAHFVE